MSVVLDGVGVVVQSPRYSRLHDDKLFYLFSFPQWDSFAHIRLPALIDLSVTEHALYILGTDVFVHQWTVHLLCLFVARRER